MKSPATPEVDASTTAAVLMQAFSAQIKWCIEKLAENTKEKPPHPIYDTAYSPEELLPFGIGMMFAGWGVEFIETTIGPEDKGQIELNFILQDEEARTTQRAKITTAFTCEVSGEEPWDEEAE